ncbi:transient receptor potential cation channel subfamily M member 2-like [Glandiceps talaboti]
MEVPMEPLAVKALSRHVGRSKYNPSLFRRTVQKVFAMSKFQKRECICFIQDKKSRGQDPICGCGRSQTKHAKILKEEETWNRDLHTQTSKTDAYGEIEFPGYSKRPARYIRLDYKTKANEIVDLLVGQWNLTLPSLLISVTGGAKDFTMTSKLKQVLRRGLTQVALSTNVWIITGGTHTGIMKHVGETVRDYTMGSRSTEESSIVTIGIAPWGIVHHRNTSLINKDDTNRARDLKPVHYKVDDPEGNEASLDPNHTHFILVDDGTEYKFETEISLRSAIEEAISKKHVGVDGEIKIPTVCLALEGGPGTIETVKSALSKKIPVVIVAGSGRAADVLAWAVKQATKHKKDGSFDQGLKERLMKALGNTDKSDSVKVCLEPENLALITIFDLDSKGSTIGFDLALLKAVLKKSQIQPNLKKTNELHLAVAWNRIDIASELLFSDSKKWNKLDMLGKPLQIALTNGQKEFVKLFLENGVCLQEFLQSEILCCLYNQKKSGQLLLRVLSKLGILQKDQERKVKLPHVTLLLRNLMYANYELPPEYDLKDKADTEHRSILHRQLFDCIGNQNQEISDFVNPRRELIYWSVLLNHHDLVNLFLEDCEDAIGAALVAARISNKMAEWENDVDNKEDMLNRAKAYETFASNVLTECYNCDEKHALLLLVRRLDSWGKCTCLRLAFQARCMNFISNTAVQELLDIIWYGRLDGDRTSFWKLFCCLACPLLACCLLKYREQSDDNSAEIMKTFKSKDNDNTREERQGDGNQCSDDEEQSNTDESDEVRSIGVLVTNKILTPTQKFKYFLGAPVVKFYYSMFYSVLLLGLFSYIALTHHDKMFSAPEILLMVWITTLVFEEIRQIVNTEAKTTCAKLKYWCRDKWNILDLISLVIFYVGLIVRMLPFSGMVRTSRCIWAVDVLFFYIRFLQFFSVHREIGPKLIMIGKMMVDLIFFVGIVFVIMLGYGISVQAILYPLETRPSVVIPGIFYKSYFQVYGELFLDEIEGDNDCSRNETIIMQGAARCPEYNSLVLLLLALYMILSNVLLLNLLIAMFSYTFAAVHENTDIFWKFQRCGLIIEFHDRPTLCAPFIIFYHVWICLVRCWDNKPRKIRLVQKLTSGQQMTLSRFERTNVEKYFRKKEELAADNINEKVKDACEKLDTIVDYIERNKYSSESEEDDMGDNLQQRSSSPPNRTMTSRISLEEKIDELLKAFRDGKVA